MRQLFLWLGGGVAFAMRNYLESHDHAEFPIPPVPKNILSHMTTINLNVSIKNFIKNMRNKTF